jgi:MFS family permease
MIKKNTVAALKLIAFVEGGSVMACELFGAKLIAPYFGSSLYVWASVLSVTLGGLAAGYYSGGYLSKKYDNKKMLFGVLLMAGCFLFFMPFLAKFTLNRLIYFDIRTGSLLSLMVYMFPVLFFFGSSSPLIINILTEEKDDSGKNAGTIYAISTVGGIIYTLIIGFFILPEYGITKPAMFFGFFIICISVAFFIFRKDYFMLIIPLVFIAVSVYKYYKSESFADHRIIYKSEGILGQIKVVDSYYYSDESGWNPARYLLVNNILKQL